jgi:hypothetical protein
VTDCAYAKGRHHSEDRVEVHHGTGKPVTLCGYHATPEWLPIVLRGLPR